MSTDYLDAAWRHHNDATLLYEKERWPNADQLYGLAAECGLKAIMQALGMRLGKHGAPEERRHRVHIDTLWDEYQTFVFGREAEQLAALGTNVFTDWSIHQRYWSTRKIERDAVDRHKNGAETVWRLVSLARLDGRLP